MRFERDFIQLLEEVETWQKAIEVASKPLLDKEIINQNYIDAMIRNIKEMGPYVVISKDIALPHGRAEDGAFESAISILKLNNRISFGNEKNVNVIIVLASSKDSDHMETLKFVSTLLSEQENYQLLIESDSIDDIYKLFKERRE